MSSATEHSTAHLLIRVSGTVQGVGFRPFIYKLARSFGLVGSVWNNSAGVFIHAQGRLDALPGFVQAIKTDAPPAARVDEVVATPEAPGDFTEFRILPSEVMEEAFTQVSPDLALCADCRRELDGDNQRRAGYPFNNCTNCGPRFTIIQALPYDRPMTTMSEFAMCVDCRREYEDPEDRRFHAQPVACHRCGPRLTFLERKSDEWKTAGSAEDSLARTVGALRNGKIALVQGIGGFHLACDARHGDLVQELRGRKHRDEKPFAVMFSSEKSLLENCEASAIELAFLRSYRAPIVLLKKRASTVIAEAVAPGNPYIGAMLPYSPLHVLLLNQCGFPLVMTSANTSDEPIAYRAADALERMQAIADVALVHNRRIHMFADDSVVKVIAGKPRVWRRSRGYVPESVHVPEPFRVQTLAFGPQLKNTFCLGKQNFALLSQHLGDLEKDLAFEAHEAALHHFLALFDAKIELAACDLHPDYATTRLAEEWCEESGIPLVRVQHHHAHLAACLAENGRTERAIGLCLDGTGYGTDGTIWGGEVLLGDFRSFDRVAHLETVPMPGGERAAKEPWRMALAWLRAAHGENLNSVALPLLDSLRAQFGEHAIEMLTNSRLSGGIFPITSSLGRLFDAVSAMIFFGARRQYEGQAAMLLEGMLSTHAETPYLLDCRRESEGWILTPQPMIREMVGDIAANVDCGVISRRFHQGIVNGFACMCNIVRESSGVKVVALSGGCFQNSFLLTEMESRLTNDGFEVLSHEQVPANDGGVSLGQAVIANAWRE